jgi:hypothetical protein
MISLAAVGVDMLACTQVKVGCRASGRADACRKITCASGDGVVLARFGGCRDPAARWCFYQLYVTLPILGVMV